MIYWFNYHQQWGTYCNIRK